MKILILYILLTLASYSEDADKYTKITFQSTYPEGFGTIFKKEAIIKKIKSDPNARIQEDKYILISPENNSEILVRGMRSSVKLELEKIFLNVDSMKIKFIGYEAITSEGSPRLSKGVKDTEVVLPDGPGWGVGQIIYLISIETKVVP